MARTYTIREAAEITTKSYAALRGMADRGQIETSGGGKTGRTRRISYDELKRAGLLRADELLAESAAQDLSLQVASLSTELRDVEVRLTQQLARIEVLLTKHEEAEAESSTEDKEPELRAA